MELSEQLNLSFIKYFVDAVDLNGVTESANHNNVSRAAVSQALKRLQDILGYSLTTRKKNHFVVTPDGRMFYLKAREILSSLKSILGQQMESKSILRVGCSASLFEPIVVPALKTFTGDIRVKFGTSSAIKEFVQDEKIDLGILIDDGHTEQFDRNEIRQGNFILVGKKDGLNKGVIVTEDRPEVISLMKDLHKLDLSTGLNRIKVDSWTGCCALASHGLGACLVPDFFKKKSLIHLHKNIVRYPYKIVCIRRRGEFRVELEKLLKALTKAPQ